MSTTAEVLHQTREIRVFYFLNSNEFFINAIEVCTEVIGSHIQFTVLNPPGIACHHG